MPDLQTVDPEVSRAKFARELADYRSMEAVYRKRGWFLLDAEFPEVFVVFASPTLKPHPLVAAVVIDFADYDLQPPSVKFVDPFTGEPLLSKDMRFVMLRHPEIPGVAPDAVALMVSQGSAQPSALIQSHRPETLPFLCLQGVREYHENPAHSGDPWLLHRNTGAGSLAFILDKIWIYGVRILGSFQAQIQVKVGEWLAVSLQAIPA